MWRFFVDREQELDELQRLADRPKPTLILLYGRRRVGKTYLLEQAWHGRRCFYFLAADSTAEMNRAELLRELEAWSALRFDPSDYPTWRTIFRLFLQLAREDPLIVVLDEFQYLMGQQDDIVAQLVAVWDREAGDMRLTLALCGSEVGTLEGLQHGGQPLYGRPNWSARLRSFDYRDTVRMVPDRPPREACLLFGAFGGTPRYLATLEPHEDVPAAVIRHILSPRGSVHLQLQYIIEQEKGIRQPAEYRAVLAAVADGRTQINAIAQQAGFQDRPHVARRALAVLEDLELVWKERNYDAPAKAPHRYHIADNAVRFWYRFVHPNRSRLETGDPAEVWQERVEPFVNDYMGGIFEAVARQAFGRYHQLWGLPGAVQWSRWEGRDRNRRSIEIDIVARLDDGRVLTGEVKWSTRPVGYELHLELLRDLDDLSRSGHQWAREALSEEASAGHLYLSAAGFNEEFQEKVAHHATIRLLTLEHLYLPQ